MRTNVVVVWNEKSCWPISILEILDNWKTDWKPEVGGAIPTEVCCNPGLCVGTAEGKIVAVLTPEEEALFDSLENLGNLFQSDCGVKCLQGLLEKSISIATGIPIPEFRTSDSKDTQKTG